MTNVTVHKHSNEKWGRYHQPWINKFTKYLATRFDVTVKDYNESGNKFTGPIEMCTEIGPFGKNPPLSDVDFVVENTDNGEYFVLTFHKNFNSYAVNYLKSEKCIGILAAHFSYSFIYNFLKAARCLHRIDKVHPWFFGFYSEFDVDKFRKVRDEAESLASGLFFKGSGWKDSPKRYRAVVGYLHEKGYLDASGVPFDRYLNSLATQGIAMSYYLDLDKNRTFNNHPGEMCYRDIEMMSIGVPYIRVEYKAHLQNAFLPNYHYITIPREDAFLAFETGGNEKVAELFIEKYKEVKDDKDFLKYITTNQRKWYDEVMAWPKSAELTFKLLDLQKWIS